jgi:hypothetical protein
MQGMKKSLPELLSMLKTAEMDIKKEHQVLMIKKNTSSRRKAKGISLRVRKVKTACRA